MNELQTLQAQLALEIEIGREVLRKGLTAFPPRPELRWMPLLGWQERKEAEEYNRELVDQWKADIREWKRVNAISERAAKWAEQIQGA